jgi:hypothetical protein
VTREELDLLVRRAGLTLNAGQKADLAVAFQHLLALAACLPRRRPLADEPAFVFHPPLSPPGPEPGQGAARTAARTPTKTAAKPKAAPKVQAKAQAKAQTRSQAKGKPARPKAARRR